MVGINKQNDALTVNVDYNSNQSFVESVNNFSSSAQIGNVKSYAIVYGNNNVGGVVGKDINGVYSNIMFQVLANTQTAVSGNENVGGIVGYTEYGKFIFCSVMSYKWDYSKVQTGAELFTSNTVTIHIL